MPLPLGSDARTIRDMTDILSEMEVRDGSIKGSAIVSWDAFFITGALEKSINENLVASIAATLISIGQIAVESTGIGELEEVGIMSKQGLIFVSRISNEFLLATFASPNARLRLGMIFSLIAKTADSVRKLSKSAKQ